MMRNCTSKLLYAGLLPVVLVVATGCGKRARAQYGPPDIRRVTGIGVMGVAPPAEDYSRPAPAPAPPPAPSYNMQGTVTATGYGTPGGGRTEGQNKLMAKRAASVEADRNLLEQVEGAEVSSSTSVRNFVTENDQIQSRVQGVIRNAKIVDEGVDPDGNYYVVKEVDLSDIGRILQDYAPAPAPAPRSVSPTGRPTTGGPVTAQERAKAKRAATLDGYRQLLEMAKGVRLSSGSTVEEFMLRDDSIRTRVEGIIRGAQITDTRYLPDGTVEVDMAFDMNTVRYNVR